ncbi:MAG: hypothetical protein D4R90_04455 [Nitrosopumilales archaeon]|nr:MAG: hypothetical protein D4R90_04455 [Nitrosopumilales archaeon]
MTLLAVVSINEDDKIAFVTCIEVVLMKRGDVNHKLVLAKLSARYYCGIDKCLEHPEYLKDVMKEVYGDDYNSVVDAISLEIDKLEYIDEFKADFFKFMMS